MKMDFALNLTQEQKLIMTQEMQLSIKLLQMSGIELQEYVNKELQENPVLEAESAEKEEGMDYRELLKYLEFDNYGSRSYEAYDEDKEEVSPFHFISSEKSFTDYIESQIRELDLEPYMQYICMYLANSLDEKGYLSMPIDDIERELKLGKDEIMKAVNILQSLDPLGVGAQNLGECLKIQLKAVGKYDDNICKIIDFHLEDIADNRVNKIAKALGITPKEAQDYSDIIKKLEPKPSRGFYSGEDTRYIVPDAYIKNASGRYFIIMNDGITPKLYVNNIYKDIIYGRGDKEAEKYVKEKIDKAVFLMKSIESRKSTVYRVLEKITERQMEFLSKGREYLHPMTMKEIADELSLHESTVSRAVRDKYVYTPRGMMKIKDFFTQGIPSACDDVSNVRIKNEIQKFINDEDKKKPISDQLIADRLKDMGMDISRRTVAKYREELGIKSSSKRKRI